jgi:hypothetical protein
MAERKWTDLPAAVEIVRRYFNEKRTTKLNLTDLACAVDLGRVRTLKALLVLRTAGVLEMNLTNSKYRDWSYRLVEGARGKIEP